MQAKINPIGLTKGIFVRKRKFVWYNHKYEELKVKYVIKKYLHCKHVKEPIKNVLSINKNQLDLNFHSLTSLEKNTWE